MPTSILLAGLGNELRQDDAFGIAFVRHFAQQQMPAGMKIMEVGTGGIHLVQELHQGYDMLLLADAVDWGAEAGRLYLQEVTAISNLDDMPVFEKRTFLADMHYTNPMRALMLAKALQVLPKQVYILGCEVAQHHDFAIGLSEAVAAAIPKAATKLRDWLALKT